MKSRNLIVIICLLMTLSCWTVVWGDDTTPPNAPTVTGIADDRGSSNTDAITNDPTLTISGTAEANSTVEVFRDGGSIGTTPVNGSGDWTFDYTGTSLDDGLYSFTATATDAAGNTSAASSAFNVLIDAKKPPAPDGRDPANNTYTNENTPTFSWSEPTDLPDPGGSGVRDYHIIVYDSTHTQVKDSYPSNTQYTPSSGSPLDDDAYMWKLATRDVAGNTGAWGAEWTLVVDTEDPTVTVTSPNGSQYWAGGSTKTITWTASDTNFGATPIDLHYTTNGTDWTEIAIGEANDGSYSWSPVPNLDLSTVKVRVTATDLAGNSASDQSDADFTIDSTRPETTGLDLPDTESVDANCTITIPYSATVTDNLCIDAGGVSVVVEFVTGGGTATLNAPPATIVNQGGSPNTQVNVSGSFTVSDLTAGDVVIRVRINGSDCAGNAAIEASDTVTIGDSTIPVIAGLDLPNTDQSVDEFCSITIPYSATVADNCCLDAGGVSVVVEFVDPHNTAILTAPPASIVNSGGGIPNDTVSVSGSFTVSNLTGDPVQVRVRINGTDCNGNAATQASDVVTIVDSTIPVIVWNIELPPSPQYVDSAICTIALPIQATVTDNCCILAGNVSVDISVTNATLAHDVTVVHVGADVLVSGDITVSALTGCPAVLSVAIDATDCCGNAAIQLTDTVNIIDNTIPVINDLTVSDETVDANCEATVTFSATVTDNCCVTPGAVTVDVTLLTGNATLGTPVINKVQNGQSQVDVSGSVLVSALSGCPATVQVTIDATDCCGNDATQVSDTGYVTDTSIPVINDLVVDDHVLVSADCCETTVNFTANVTDNCCIVPDNVAVTVTLPTNNAILENIVVNRVQNGQGRVDITGSADVRCLTSCPARVEVHIEATDCCGNDAVPVSSTATEGRVYDETIPDPKDDRFRWIARGGDAPFQLDVMQNDTDNCSSCTCCGTMWIHDIVDPPEYGTATIEVDHGDCNGGSSIRYAQYHGYCGTDEFTYRIEDSCGNVSSTATVFVNLIAETVMDDIYLTTCTNNLISFAIEATDPRINPRNPDEIPFVFSIVTPPMHGVISGDLGDMTYTVHGGTTEEIESAAITLLYTPAAGFTGRDALTLRFSDPFGGSSTAMVDIAVIECAGQPGAPPPFALRQGEIFPLIVPLTFASVYEKEWNTVTLIAETDGTVYQGALSATWEESIGRYVLGLDTASLPPGLYRMTIPLGNGETVTLMIEVSEAI